MSGGDKADTHNFLEQVRTFVEAGGAGLAVGRNVWQAEDPEQLTKQIKQIIFS
jgi:class I fructose-bisphosphate aldolase